MRVGERLKEAIRGLGLSIKAAAAMSGVPYRTLQDYLRLQREPNAETLALLCTHLRISGDWLLTGEGEKYRDRNIADRKDELNGVNVIAVVNFDQNGNEIAPQTAAPVPTAADPAPVATPPALPGLERRLDAFLGLIAQLDPQEQSALLAECFTRAQKEKQLADLRQAVTQLQADHPPRTGTTDP